MSKTQRLHGESTVTGFLKEVSAKIYVRFLFRDTCKLEDAIRRDDSAALARQLSANKIHGRRLMNLRLSYSLSLMELAIRMQRPSCVKILLDYGFDPNSRGSGPDGPLIQAASYGEVEIVKYLLEAGADVNSRSSFMETPLAIAVSNGAWDSSKRCKYRELIEILMENNADPTLVDMDRSSLLIRIFDTEYHPDIPMSFVEFILDPRFKQNINYKNRWNDSALILSWLTDNYEVFKLLIDRGADPYIENDCGQNIFWLLDGCENDEDQRRYRDYLYSKGFAYPARESYDSDDCRTLCGDSWADD